MLSIFYVNSMSVTCVSPTEIIPRTLAQNCGANTIRTLTALRAKHAAGGLSTAGIDGETGEIVDMAAKGIWEPLAVKLQVRSLLYVFKMILVFNKLSQV